MRIVVVLALAAAGCNQVLGLDPVTVGDGGGPPTIDAPPARVDQIVAGGAHTCARVGDTVRCWGAGTDGQLGTAGTTDVLAAAAAPAIDVEPVAFVAAGDRHTCARTTDGRVACWGAGANGRLGYGNESNIGDTEAPRSAGTVDLGAPVVGHLAAGAAHTCAAVPGIAVRCWGASADGRLGNNAMEDVGDTETPAMSFAVAGTSATTGLAAGGAHTCTIDGSGNVACFGRGDHGQLGYASVNSLPAPGGMVQVGDAASAIVAGAEHTCVIQSNSAVKCWGNGLDGRLGLRGTTDVGATDTPAAHVSIVLGGNVEALAAGARHTCALLTGGAVVCWGANDHGQLGYGDRAPRGDNEDPAAAGPVPLPDVAIAITAGGDHTCALLVDHRVVCWGANDRGQLGYGDRVDRGDDDPVGERVPL